MVLCQILMVMIIKKTSEMKQYIKNTIKAFGIFLVLGLAFTSCESEEDLQLPRLFRPVSFNVEMNKTEATFTWAKADSAISYTLQVSTDSINYSNPVLDTTITETVFVQEFAGKTQYYARLMANASTETKNSKFNIVSFKTPSENILLLNQIMVNAKQTVQIAWEAARKVTHIELEPAGGAVEKFNVSAAEGTTGLKTCLVAGNNVNYTLRVYNGSILRGSTTIRVEGDVFLTAEESLKSAIEAASGSAYVIMLQPGEYSVSGNIAIPNGTSLILRGVDKSNRSKVNVQNNTVVFALPAIADSLIIGNIDFAAVTPSNTAYFINQSAAAKVGKVKFDGCNLTGFGNNILRFQNATGEKRITDFIVNNVVVTNCGNGSSAMPSNGTYAFVNSNIDNGYITNIKISNSTFNGVSHSLLNVPGLSGSTTTNIVKSIIIENSTFYNIVGGSSSVRFLIDGGITTNNASIDISLKNLIFGKTMATNTPGGGIRKASGTLDVQNVYTTSDWNAAVVIPNAISFAGSSTDLWVDPANGNFKIKATSFAGKGTAGDMRWY